MKPLQLFEIFLCCCLFCLITPSFGQELLSNGGFEELYPCKTCDGNDNQRRYELLGKNWECLMQSSTQQISFFPYAYIWKDTEQSYQDLICYEPDAAKFRLKLTDCPSLDVPKSPADEIITVSVSESLYLLQKLQQPVKKGDSCKLKIVFFYSSSCQKTSLKREIAFFLAKKKPKNTMGTKARLAEIKRCEAKLIQTFNLDSLSPMQWHEKEFTFTAEDDFEYFIGGGLKRNFYDTEYTIPKCLDEKWSRCYTFRMTYDRISLQKMSISEETKKIALSPDSLLSTNVYKARGRFVRLKSAIFDKNAELTKNTADLDKIANFLLANPNLKILIEGHTDSDGNEKLNQTLSEKRAESVKKYFVGKGVKVENIETKGLSSTMPISSLQSENRRVEISFR